MNFYERTDLACETYVLDDEKNKKNGIISSLFSSHGYDVIKTEITSKTGEEITGKKIGKYLTLYTGNVYKYTENEQDKISKALAFCIKEILSFLSIKETSFLVAALGNKDIKSDSLGPLCIEKLTPTHHLKNDKMLYSKFGYDLSLIPLPVLGKSGIESGELLKKALTLSGAECVFIIDSCVTKSIDRLCTTIQLSNVGILPGSGINYRRHEISKSSLGVPVISIGVPCAISASTLIYSQLKKTKNIDLKFLKSYENLYLSPSDIDLFLPVLSNVIKNAIIEAIK